MKRFVTYLYEYERGMKTKNVGFIRVDIRSSVVSMEISVRKLHSQSEQGIVLGIVVFDDLQCIELGEIQLQDGQGDVRLQLPVRNLQGKPVTIDDVLGIAIQFESGSYIASCWKDDYAEEIAKAEYRSWEDSVQTVPPQKVDINVASVLDAEVEILETNVEHTEMQTQQLPITQYCYRKLDLTHMYMLPMQDRHYSSNAFLVHGFWNYGYVVLKTEIAGNEKKAWLGVPGIYERPEAAMALAFGFPLFEAVPSEIMEAPINVERCFSEQEIRARSFCQKDAKETRKNQPSNEKLFGCWFVELHM